MLWTTCLPERATSAFKLGHQLWHCDNIGTSNKKIRAHILEPKCLKKMGSFGCNCNCILQHWISPSSSPLWLKKETSWWKEANQKKLNMLLLVQTWNYSKEATNNIMLPAVMVISSVHEDYENDPQLLQRTGQILSIIRLWYLILNPIYLYIVMIFCTNFFLRQL